ncbi:DUF1778 domain-containing protein [Actinoplanes couchii]|uniref:DUF1778 domain-containing protein n=1 Tax=Actinoplanes couchii TaxID=403638 RepID=A0ABQ3XBP7_9ACTN|nr:DUF1778 domain-containing protein [Actinoplanes couchii]MDR6323432.1 uncharacterized protein (DUF1778 family) [Actinoplanes couchii]GID55946.1 hypothetical protein Aco03nite_043500 [Actinoplanes couchii]
MTIAASARFEFRLRPEAKSRIEQAAELVHESTSDFARTAAEERADRVLQAHSAATVVPGAFFDDLLRALDEPTMPNSALREAARRSRGIVERR